MGTTEFWEDHFVQRQDRGRRPSDLPDCLRPAVERALDHFGDLNNRKIIDLGCGSGETSIFLAKCGASVISVDLSSTAINILSDYCRTNDINNVFPTKMAAQDIASLGKVDFVFGSMILHHIEPFTDFTRALKEVVGSEGKCFFWENNARSNLMMWFRKNVVGKYWIPKHGDDDEYPLTQGEICELEKHFSVRVEYPELLLFRMISTYLLRGHIEPPFSYLDRLFFRFDRIKKLSYWQYILLS